MSKLEEDIHGTLRKMLGPAGIGFERNIRPAWLKYKNGYNLELDFLIPKLAIGIEVQGMQHFQFTPHFHKSEEDYIAQIERDQWKKDQCLLHKIKFIEIYESEEIVPLIREIIIRIAGNKIQIPFKKSLKKATQNLVASEQEIVDEMKAIRRERQTYYAWIGGLNIKYELLNRQLKEIHQKREFEMIELLPAILSQ